MDDHVITERLEKAIELVKQGKADQIDLPEYNSPTMRYIIKKLTGKEPKYNSYQQRKNEMIRAIKKELKQK